MYLLYVLYVINAMTKNNTNHIAKNNTNHILKICNSKSSVGISNKLYYNQIAKLSDNKLRSNEVNKFTVNFTLHDKSLINITKPLIPLKNNPDKYVFVLETTINKFMDYIRIPDIHTFYKDIFGGNCIYNKNTKELTAYNPRLRFKFYNEGNLIYCTTNDDYANNESRGSHASLLFNPAFMNIVKVSQQIINEKYKQDTSILKTILDNICTLFNITGIYKDKIATLLILIMSQESLAILSPLIIKLFNMQYILSEQLSNTIHKCGTKYIIKQQNLIKGLIPVNNIQPAYNNFSLTYIIDEQDPCVIIKMDIIDIDGLIKSYPNFPESLQNTMTPITNNNYTIPVIEKNKVNFVSY